MATPSKATRRLKNAHRAKRRAFEVVRNVARANVELSTAGQEFRAFAEQQYENNVRLARLVGVLVARYGKEGEIRIAHKDLVALPAGARLREMNDVEKGEWVLMTVIDEDVAAEQPRVEVVTPKIEVVSR